MARPSKPILSSSNQIFNEDEVGSSFSYYGAVEVIDLDIGQTLSASDNGRPVLSFTGGSLSDALSGQLLSALGTGKLVFTSEPPSGVPTQIDYTWNPDDVALDFMTAGQSLTITYKIQAKDSAGSKSRLQELSFTITGVDDPPTANGDDLAATEDVPETYAASALLGNDTDPDSPSLSIASVGGGFGGSATPNDDGTITFTPDANFFGNATFEYTVSDGALLSLPATVTVAVAGVNDAPTTSEVALAAVAENSGGRLITQGELIAGAQDVDGDLLSATGLAIAAGLSTLTDNGDGSWTYAPAPNDESSVSFSYTVSDGHGGSAAGSATMDITSANQAPTISGSFYFDAHYSIHFQAEDADGDMLTFESPFASFGPVNNGTETTFVPAVQLALIEGDLRVTDGWLATPVGLHIVLGTTDPDSWSGVSSPTPTAVYGFDGDDTLIGSSSAAKLFGGAGNDALSGGDGYDVLAGQTGDDLLFGGNGQDVFVFMPGEQDLLALVASGGTAGYDKVSDFALFVPGAPPEILLIPGSAVAGPADHVVGMPSAAIWGHSIGPTGLISFHGFAGEFIVSDASSLAEVVSYLLSNDIGVGMIGASVAFIGTMPGVLFVDPHTWLYSEGVDTISPLDDILVDLVGVVADGGVWKPGDPEVLGAIPLFG